MSNNAQSDSDILKDSKEEKCTHVFCKRPLPVEMYMNPKLTTKDIYDTLWRCRDFELSHLWQRSIFLSGFLILCFTGYGFLLVEVVEGDLYDFKMNVLAMILCFVSALFSALWIMMGKGSKAWYEKYENGIVAFERNRKYADESSVEIGGFACDKINSGEDNGTNKFELLDLDNCLFSGKGGEYSPSRINIAIGQISLLLWMLALIIHTTLAFNFWNTSTWGTTQFLVSIIVVFVLLIILFFFPKCFKSGCLSILNKNNK